MFLYGGAKSGTETLDSSWNKMSSRLNPDIYGFQSLAQRAVIQTKSFRAQSAMENWPTAVLGEGG